MTDTAQLIDEIQSFIRRAYKIGEVGDMGELSGLQIELSTHLSGKLILDRKQVEDMIEKRKDKMDALIDIGNPIDGYYILTNEAIQDLNSLLPNQANDSD